MSSEFILPVSHSIKEQILDFQKSFANERTRYYQIMYNNTARHNAAANKKVDINSYIRDVYSENTEWQPVVKKINPNDIKKFEKKEERKIRYVQRKK
jgi:hypothetical protein